MGRSSEKTPMGERPEFYLIYLSFYFFPWFFKTPSLEDVLAAIIAISIFIPVYFRGFRQRGRKSWLYIGAISLIGFAVSPFFGSHGVFHIYAMVQTGFMRPERFAWVGAIILTLVFSIVSWLSNQSSWDFGFPIALGFLTITGVISTASRIEQSSQLERSMELEQHLATVSERERIAQDLHDLLGQTLTMVALKSEVATRVFDSDPSKAKQELNEIRDAARIALKDVREAVAGMNTTSLNAELKRAQQILSAADIKLIINGQVPQLNPATDQVLGLTVRETMTNIVRHSMAKHAILNIIQSDTELNIIIEDDGINDKISEGSGLIGLRKRIEKLGGSTHLEQVPGLKISMKLPNWQR
jgi:two-component system sensor histidine kinase DesK